MSELVPRDVMGRRVFLTSIALGALVLPRRASAMGLSGAFAARRMVTTGQRKDNGRDSGLAKWGWELVRRTSAPARLDPTVVGADGVGLLDEPFAIWSGDDDPGALLPAERRGLESFLRLGGILIVDDSMPESGRFGSAARRELRRIVAENPPVVLDPNSVIYKSFYLVRRPSGRCEGSGRVEAIIRGRLPQVIFLSCDLLGALATRPDGSYLYEVDSRTTQQREQAIRFAVNLAMYVLCSDYKDDQVHAEWLMRRRVRWSK